MDKKENHLRRIALGVCEAFALVTIIMMILRKQYDRIPLAVSMPFILLIQKAVECTFHCRISLPVYLFGLFYALGPMLGQCHNLYYLVPWWDKMLHMIGGVMFAFFGLFLFEAFVEKNKRKRVMTAIFAICFSMAIGTIWEFSEFAADTFFGMDMQDDVVITHINSYLLDDGVGVTGSIENIQEVLVNGQSLPVKGYIDIGLIDTMLDMLLEALGAVAVAIAYILSKGRFTVFQKTTS